MTATAHEVPGQGPFRHEVPGQRPVSDELPVVVIGAGPVGLAAAAHLTDRGLPVLVVEAGERVGAAMAQWGQRMPKSFTKPTLGLASLRALLRNLRRSPDLSLRKLITLMRMFG